MHLFVGQLPDSYPPAGCVWTDNQDSSRKSDENMFRTADTLK